MGTNRPHPVISALQFNNSTRDTDGATMNVHTHKFTGIGDSGYGVGGATGDDGAKIPSHTTSPSEELHSAAGTEPRLETTLGQMARIKKATAGNPDSNIGSWRNDSGRIDFDASDVIHDRTHAERVGRQRKELGIFDYKHGTTIRTDD